MMDSMECFESSLEMPSKTRKNSIVDSPIFPSVFFPKVPPLQVVRDLELEEYFTRREARPEFFENQIYSDRNALPPYSLRKAQRIFLKGAIRHKRSLEQDALFASLWKPRMMNIRIAEPQVVERPSSRNDQACQVSRSLFQTTSIPTMSLKSNKQIEYVHQPVLQKRNVSMMKLTASKPKFELTQVKSSTLSTGIENMVMRNAKTKINELTLDTRVNHTKEPKSRKQNTNIKLSKNVSLHQTQQVLRTYYNSMLET